MGCIIKRLLQFNEAVVFGPLKILDKYGKDITEDCLFSWSSDSVCWTNWVNYKTYLTLARNVNSDFYLRVLFTTDIDKVFINDMETKCYSICLFDENPFLQDFCGENLFNPYIGLDCALLLQQQLANSIICILGIPIYYFRVLPQKNTADYTFKEYVMHNVESVKQMKLMIPDGTMPSSKPTFTDYDFDWEVDWEVELSKTEFARAFGDTSFPKQRDFIYIPMMKRMWEVNSAYDEKNEGLMWRSTTWKLGLIKWNEKTNVEQGDFDKFIDNLVVNTYDNIFAELEENEEVRTTATTQVERPLYTANGLHNVFTQDAIRKQMTLGLIDIFDKQYNNGSVTISKNMYAFKKDSETGQEGMITYQKGYCGEDGVVSFIIDTKGQVLNEYKPIMQFGNIVIESDGGSIRIGDAVASLQKTHNDSIITEYMVICKWNRRTFIQEISAFPYIKPDDVPAYKIKPEMNRFDFSVIEPNGSCEYCNDNISNKPQEVVVTAYPMNITNIKLFNKYMSNEDAIKESIKYTTTSECCVFNDLARQIDTGMGYSVK